MRIAIGCDHGGIILKEAILNTLAKMGIEAQDYGTYEERSCDYPDYALSVAEAVADGICDKGILLCGTGIGISIAANKVKGIRAAVCHNLFTAKACAAHNDANVITMGGRVVDQKLACEIVTAWLTTPFEGDRHVRRLDKIRDIENKYMK